MTGACATRCPDGCDIQTLRALVWGIPPRPAPRPRPMVAAGPIRALPPMDVARYLPAGPRRVPAAPPAREPAVRPGSASTVRLRMRAASTWRGSPAAPHTPAG
jgi:hypothetical protein